MTLLHAHFHLRNQQAFQRLLDASRQPSSSNQGTSSSGGRSWNRPSPLSSAAVGCDVNARDALGRTVLHLAASSTDSSAPEYVRMLLAHPAINPNLRDMESHWTALHRALYNGNLASALLLLQRVDVDTNLKDLEGYRAFDLYNSTVEGTKPGEDLLELYDGGSPRADLFTWGANRNAALGLGDGDDRMFPDQVVIERTPLVSATDSLDARFEPVRVKQIVMSNLHTAIVTNEPRGNFRVCGFGSGGRLGLAQHTQYTFTPIPAFASLTITSVALGQDHTLALTSTGEVFSWGLNRFGQLGYVIENTGTIAKSEEIQSVPRKVPGLKGKVIKGVAACKTASICWTGNEVWSWGTNGGQLGYDRAAQPVQVSPRRVTKITQPVLSVTITDSAIACLLDSHDVICLWNDGYFKINFPTQSFPSEITTYRPPQAVRNTSIQKVTSCDYVFAALSTNGELFTFYLPRPGEATSREREGRSGGGIVKPQRVWALRKQFSAVRDVALGGDGTIIICTEAGHVFIRSLNLKSAPAGSSSSLATGGGGSNLNGKAFKFQRVPNLQSVIRVCANNTGAFGAIRFDHLDAHPGSFDISGKLIEEDLKAIQPYLKSPKLENEPLTVKNPPQAEAEKLRRPRKEATSGRLHAADENEEDDHAILKDIEDLEKLCDLLERDKRARKARMNSGSKEGLFDPSSARQAYGADLIIQVLQSGLELPAHRVMLAARSAVLGEILCANRIVDDPESNIRMKLVFSTPSSSKSTISTSTPVPPPYATKSRLSISGCHPLSVLILLTYIYSDEVLAPWDPRVSTSIDKRLASPLLKAKSAQVKFQLQCFARILELSALGKALEAPVKRTPTPLMAKDMQHLFDTTHSITTTATTTLSYRDPLKHDVVMLLEDKEVPCHSTILRARSDFFAAFFDDEDWTRNRWTADGVVQVDLRHMNWKAMQFVLRFLYGGDLEMFDRLEFVESVDELLEFMFDVMAAANELLLDRLVLLCSSIILRRINTSSAYSVLAEATHYHAISLVESIQCYMAISLETLLTPRMLDDLPSDVLKQLSAFVRKEQASKSPVSRSGALTQQAMEKFKDWLALQDIPPQAIVRTASTAKIIAAKDLANANRVSPPISTTGSRKQKQLSMTMATTTTPPPGSPLARPQIPTRQPPPEASVGIGGDEMFVMDEGVPVLSLNQNLPAASKTDPSERPINKPTGGWKVSSTPRVDMKAIMAEAETTKTAASQRIPFTSATRPPCGGLAADASNWRTPRTPQQTSRALPETPGGSLRAPGSPWRVPSIHNLTAASSSNNITPLNPLTPSSTHMTRVVKDNSLYTLTSTTPSMGSGSGIRREPSTPPKLPGMGPVFSPSKKKSPTSKGSSSSGVRRVSNGGKAWTLPPVQPVVQSTPSGSAISLVAIQQLQLEQDGVDPTKKDKRSLKEIQDEERARQVEEDFLKWWTAEEERLQLEQALLITLPQGERPRQQKKGKSRGKGQERRNPEQKQQGGGEDSSRRSKGRASRSASGKDAPKSKS